MTQFRLPSRFEPCGESVTQIARSPGPAIAHSAKPPGHANCLPLICLLIYDLNRAVTLQVQFQMAHDILRPFLLAPMPTSDRPLAGDSVLQKSWLHKIGLYLDTRPTWFGPLEGYWTGACPVLTFPSPITYSSRRPVARPSRLIAKSTQSVSRNVLPLKRQVLVIFTPMF